MLRAPLSALILCGVLTLLPMGCAVVVCQHVYDQATLRLRYRGSTSVAVATQDQRTQVVSGGKTPDFVGYQRSGLGIPSLVMSVGRHRPQATTTWGRFLPAGTFQVARSPTRTPGSRDQRIRNRVRFGNGTETVNCEVKMVFHTLTEQIHTRLRGVLARHTPTRRRSVADGDNGIAATPHGNLGGVEIITQQVDYLPHPGRGFLGFRSRVVVKPCRRSETICPGFC